jgi:hypothetical protein|nr:MAG TPA: hypothetical protein [Bacteriophage sp.]
MNEGLTPADIAAVNGNNGWGGFGNEGLWLFAILALMGGGFGNWGNRGMGDRNATVSDVQRATDFAALERQNNETVAAVRQAAYDNQGAIKDGNYNVLGEIRDLQSAAASGFARQQECCCETLRAIDGVNYNAAMNTASINANTTAQTQKILDAISGNRMADMQNQINQLQLHAALCGIPRTTPYGYGIVPQFAGCNSNI